MYKRGDKYATKKGRTYFFIVDPGRPEQKFAEVTAKYCNALVNTSGGILVFGVDQDEQVQGFPITRQLEDLYKCSFDRVLRNFKPTIHPHQYRMDVLHLGECRALFEVRISAGDPTEIYQNAQQEMFVVKGKSLYGPLFPCEIVAIVKQKYKEEISTLLDVKGTNPSSPCVPADNINNSPEKAKQVEQQQKKFKKIMWP